MRLSAAQVHFHSKKATRQPDFSVKMRFLPLPTHIGHRTSSGISERSNSTGHTGTGSFDLGPSWGIRQIPFPQYRSIVLNAMDLFEVIAIFRILTEN
jgi:hypothetical protein